MKWKTVNAPQEGDQRVRSWFALIPVGCPGPVFREYRWLVRVSVVQEFGRVAKYGWNNCFFTDENDG